MSWRTYVIAHAQLRHLYECPPVREVASFRSITHTRRSPCLHVP